MKKIILILLASLALTGCLEEHRNGQRLEVEVPKVVEHHDRDKDLEKVVVVEHNKEK